MKSKVKYAALVLVIGLLSLVILPSTVFGGGPKVYEYEITIKIGDVDVATFKAPGNKAGTRIVNTNGAPLVNMTFPENILPSDEPEEGDEDYYAKTGTDLSVDYPDRCFRWSPLEDDYWGLLEDFYPGIDIDLCSDIPEKHYQTLDGKDWEFHHIGIRSNTLDCRFDLKEYIYEGTWDHYIIGIHMEEFVLSPQDSNIKIYTGDATINWTHYTEWSKPPKGKKPKIKFQQLKYSIEGELTITIEPLPPSE